MGLVAPRHVGSSRTRARTRVPCVGRRILNHCATREAPEVQALIHYLVKYQWVFHAVGIIITCGIFAQKCMHVSITHSCPGLPSRKAFKKHQARDFLGGAVVTSPPADAEDTGSGPGLGRSHMPRSGWARAPQLLSLCATAAGARPSRACAAQQEKPLQ